MRAAVHTRYGPPEVVHIERRGVLPTELVTQFEDVLADRRGYVYCTDKNGLFILRPDAFEAQA
jgi:hypothetical protein